MGRLNVNRDVEMVLQEEMEPRERLLWSGQPRQGIVLRASDIFMIPFSLLWGGFALFWEYSVIASDAPLFFALFGVPFVLVGLYVVIGRFYVEAKQRENTIYGVSTDRIIIMSGLLQRKVKSLILRTLSDVSVSEFRDGSGSIAFGSSFPLAAWFGGIAWPGMEQFMGPRFDSIQNVKQVHQVIREAQRKAA